MQGELRRVWGRGESLHDCHLPYKGSSKFHIIPRHGFGIDFTREVSKARISKRKKGVNASHCPKATRASVLWHTACLGSGGELLPLTVLISLGANLKATLAEGMIWSVHSVATQSGSGCQLPCPVDFGVYGMLPWRRKSLVLREAELGCNPFCWEREEPSGASGLSQKPRESLWVIFCQISYHTHTLNSRCISSSVSNV